MNRVSCLDRCLVQGQLSRQVSGEQGQLSRQVSGEQGQLSRQVSGEQGQLSRQVSGELHMKREEVSGGLGIYACKHRHTHARTYTHKSQEVGGTLIGEDRLVVMTGAEWVEAHNCFHGFQGFDAIPFPPFRTLL